DQHGRAARQHPGAQDGHTKEQPPHKSDHEADVLFSAEPLNLNQVKVRLVKQTRNGLCEYWPDEGPRPFQGEEADHAKETHHEADQAEDANLLRLARVQPYQPKYSDQERNNIEQLNHKKGTRTRLDALRYVVGQGKKIDRL